jgi:hypothetical protein
LSEDCSGFSALLSDALTSVLPSDASTVSSCLPEVTPLANAPVSEVPKLWASLSRLFSWRSRAALPASKSDRSSAMSGSVGKSVHEAVEVG